jgi:flagellar basal-body rod protein FlgG
MAIPANTVSVSIDKTGTVTVFDPEGASTSLGVIELYTFPNPSGLYSLGRSLYRPTPASGEAISGTPGSDGTGTIAQGFMEMSNVDVVEEMVSMIIAQRAYEVNSKAIQTADNMLQMANNIRR